MMATVPVPLVGYARPPDDLRAKALLLREAAAGDDVAWKNEGLRACAEFVEALAAQAAAPFTVWVEVPAAAPQQVATQLIVNIPPAPEQDPEVSIVRDAETNLATGLRRILRK